MSTPQPTGFYCIAQSAEHTLKGLFEIAKRWTGDGGSQIAVRTNVPGLAFDGAYKQPVGNQPGGAEGPYDGFLKSVEKKPTIICSSAEIYFRPAGMDRNQWQSQREQCTIKYSTNNGVIGRFEVNLASITQFIDTALEALGEAFPITTYIDLARTESPTLDEAALQLRERSVSDLKEQVAKMAEFMTGMAEREARNREELQTKLNEAHQQRQDQLDAEYRARKEEFEQIKATQESELDEKRKSLQTERDAFDLRSEQGVRRELLSQIQAVLQEAEKHSASPDTQKKRDIIHRVVIFLLVLGLTAAAFSGQKIFSSSGPVDWHYWVLLASATLTVITTSIYYLKWNDRWFREHADAEFAAKRYKADILRASWLAELAGEWKKTKSDVELSPLLIEAFTRNLFANVSASAPSEHPMDEMTSLLKRASEVNFGKSGFSLKGITKAAKSEG